MLTLAAIIVAAVVYYGQLREMKQANDLTQEALSASARIAARSAKDTDRALKVSADHAIAAQRSADAATASAVAARQANETTRNQFRHDQRPYIWLTSTEPGPQFKESDKNVGLITWTLHYTNYGRSPAHNVSIIHAIAVGLDASTMAVGPDAIKALSRRPFDNLVPSPIPSPLPPTKIDFFTAVFSTERVTREYFGTLTRMNQGIVVYGRFQYTDSYGAPYESVFCVTRFSGGGHHICAESYIR